MESLASSNRPYIDCHPIRCVCLKTPHTRIRRVYVIWQSWNPRLQIHSCHQCGVISDGCVPSRIENLAANFEWLQTLLQLPKICYSPSDHMVEYYVTCFLHHFNLLQPSQTLVNHSDPQFDASMHQYWTRVSINFSRLWSLFVSGMSPPTVVPLHLLFIKKTGTNLAVHSY